MHIVDGALSPSIIAAGGLLAAGGIALGLHRTDADRLPEIGVMSATFFIASLVHVPIGPSSVHLILNGLIGLALGWAAFPALFVGLLLQAVFFGFGGLFVLGVNTLTIAAPAVIVYLVCGPFVRRARPAIAAAWGAAAGAASIALTTGLVGISLAMTGQEFVPAAKLVFFAHIPIMIVEGILTGAAVLLIRKVKPTLFDRFGAAGPLADPDASLTEASHG